MNHMTLTLKPRLRFFSVPVLHLTMFLLLLTNSSGGRSQTSGSSQPIVTMVGDDIILPCYLEPAVDASDLTVEWARSDLQPKFVHLIRDGVEILNGKHSSYTERTSLSTDKLKRGDVSLKLSKVKLSDAGTYRCLVPTSGTERVVELAVGSVSPPEIKISKDGVGVLLLCESKGWYPKPEVLWLDAEGNLLSAGPAGTNKGPDGLYTVSSRVTVEKKHSKSFTCRVQQKNINQTRETHVHVADELFMVQASSAIRITVSLAVSFLCIVVSVLVVWKWRQNKTKTTEHINENLMVEEKMKYFEKTKDKLDKDSQMNEEEEEQVQHVITALKNQKEDLTEQREKLISKQKEEMKLIEKKKEEIRKFGTSYLDQRNLSQKILEDLKRKKKKREELIQNTDKLLETTDDLMIKMTEKKSNLEKDKEQIEKHLKETKRQREEFLKNLQSEQQEREEVGNDPSPDNPA